MAANTGAGPDLFWGLYSLPHLFPQKCIDITDVADYLGKKYGGWVDSRRSTTARAATNGSACRSAIAATLHELPPRSLEEGRLLQVPGRRLDAFLEYTKAMKAQGTPGGLALGHASGDGNSWAHWCLWAHGGKTVDEQRQGHHQLAGDREGAGIRQATFRQHDPGHRVVERFLEQQGVPGRRYLLDRTTASRSTSRRRRSRPKRKSPRTWTTRYWPIGAGRQADRVAPDVSGPGR